MRELTMIEKDIPLPAEYAAAERLANDMLAAATQGDWKAVVSLRREIPGMARSLDRHWASIQSRDPQQVQALQKQRIVAIRRVLAVDDQIRRLSDAWAGPLRGWLGGKTSSHALN